MKKLESAKLALVVPLAGIVVAWGLMASAMFVGLYERESGYYSLPQNQDVQWSIYLLLAAIAAIALGALWGQRKALALRAVPATDTSLARAVHRFNNLVIWIGLGLGVVFVFGNFMSAFNMFNGRETNLLNRILGVYLPIVLATALVVVVILRAFVFRTDGDEVDHEDEAAKAAARLRRRNLGLGYAVPILTTAFAIVVGLLIYDATGTELQTWVWVFIQAIVIFGIVAGTRFANRAKLGEVVVAKPRALLASLAAGAANLNFVLSLLFAGVVSIIAISSTGQAIDKLYTYEVYDAVGKITEQGSIKPLTIDWLIADLLPAKVLVLLVVVGTYLTITLRNRETAAPAANDSK
ncbi:MAG: hypothetical protein RLZZ304_1119 [Actinomycetota bacterium]